MGAARYWAIAVLTVVGCSPRGQAVIPADDFAGLSRRVGTEDRFVTYGNTGAGDTGTGDVVPIQQTSTQVADAERAPPALSAELRPRQPVRPWKFIVLHHSGTTDGDVRMIDSNHRGRVDSQGEPWLGIGYHFVIGNGGAMGDGEVEATFRWRDQLSGAHAGSKRYNDEGIGICLIGDFEKDSPTPRQVAAARQLVAQLSDGLAIPRSQCLRHGDIGHTACPGKQFPFSQIVADSHTVKSTAP